ncbi:MAG: methyltransferase domain-containing protein [bacterium]|nr:methyltransferase domain-containing protein [bacterium]
MREKFYKTYFKIEKEHWLMKVRRRVVFDVLHNVLEKNKESKILDFGCGSGILVEELSSEGYKAFGVDVSREAIRFGNSEGIKNIKVMASDKIDFPDNVFDVVTALDVLEHLENEKLSMKEIERVLKPGGVLIVMVPAYMFLWGVQDEVAHHYRRYTESSLLTVIKKSGCILPFRTTYFNSFLFFPIAAVRLLSRALNLRNRESDFDINNVFLNKLFFAIFNLERILLKKISFPFGVSILSVCKKSEKSGDLF